MRLFASVWTTTLNIITTFALGTLDCRQCGHADSRKHVLHIRKYPYICDRIYFNGRQGESRNFGHVIVFAFALLFLQLEGNSTDGSTTDALHQMSYEAGDFIAQALRLNRGNLVACSLVSLEIEVEAGVILFNNVASSLFDSFCAYAALSVRNRSKK